jgi:hypothetical protein
VIVTPPWLIVQPYSMCPVLCVTVDVGEEPEEDPDERPGVPEGTE